MPCHIHSDTRLSLMLRIRTHARRVRSAMNTMISGLPRHSVQVFRSNVMHTLDRDFTSWWAPRGIQTFLEISQNSINEPLTSGQLVVRVYVQSVITVEPSAANLIRY
jgi:hypothetical protein